ncbi:MAG: DUF177 domain-containing protein [Chthoniobacterales bacterium]
MKVHLRQIPDKGLRLEGEEDCPIPDLAAEEILCAGPLHYSLDLGISNGALWANGFLSQPVELTCVLCLERFVHTIDVPAFAMHTELAGPEVVDLTPFFREDILLNLPPYPHCDRQGGRVCPAADLQQGNVEAETERRKPDWSALDKLDL